MSNMRRAAGWLLVVVILMSAALPAAMDGEVENTDGVMSILEDPTPTPVQTPTITPTQAPTPTVTPTLDPTPTLTPTPAPTSTPTSAPTSPPARKVEIGDVYAPSAQAGNPVTISIAINFLENGRDVAYTNRDGDNRKVDPPDSSSDLVPMRSGKILDYLQYAEVTIKSGTVFASGRTAQIINKAANNNTWGLPGGTLYNLGYAVFDDVPIKSGLSNGRYQVDAQIYCVGQDGKEYDIDCTFEINITTAEPTTSPTTTPGSSIDPSATPDPSTDPSATPGPSTDPSATPGPSTSPSATPGTSTDPSATPNTDIRIGQMSVPRVKPGETITLAIPVRYSVSGEREIQSNAAAGGADVLPYSPSNSSSDYDPAITGKVSFLRVSLNQAQLVQSSFPLEVSQFGSGPTIVEGGVNYGYAVFDGVTVSSSAENGTYSIIYDVEWIDSDGKKNNTEIMSNLTVYGASSGYSGGGGGGGGGSSKPLTQAKLIVDDVYTDPVRPKAGEEFTLVMTLRNTNTSQYVQNIQLTVASSDDTVLPVSGSSSVYIDRIEAGSTYKVNMRMKSQGEVGDKPIKLEVQMEYEDKEVSAQTASENLIIIIDPVFRVKVEDPVASSYELPTANTAYTLKLQVTNEGRTTMFNTSVTATCENEDLIMPPSFFIGNMEGGTSKTADMELYPLVEGSYSVNFEVKYEDAFGQPFSERIDYAFYANPEPNYDDYNNYYEPEPEPEPEVDPLAVIRMMPAWLYAAFGALIVLMIVGIGVSARGRRRKALEDDEMD